MLSIASTLSVRTVAMPEHINSHGAIFGGWLMSQMDLAGTVFCRSFQWNPDAEDILTIKVDNLHFKAPVYIGDVVECWVHQTKLGKTSISTHILVKAKRKSSGKTEDVASGDFIYVNTYKGEPSAVKTKDIS